MTDFCTRYIALGGDIAGLSKLFLIAALLVAVAFAIVDLIVRYRAPAWPMAFDGASPASLKDLVEAIKDLVAAIASAPIWIALFAAGIFLFWVPGNALGVCTPKTEQGASATHRPSAPATPTPDPKR